jgi:general secretion pathway protein A
VKTAVIFNSLLTEKELLESILQDFGLPSKKRSKKELIDELNRFLLDQLSRGTKVVMIIDEAQNLSIPVLEQIRMLSNLETEKEKMLQIILLGQLELVEKLQSPELKQLNQRITIRHRLLPLTRQETEYYINQRLMVAGGHGKIIFSRSALDEIYRFSKGIPRLINLICDRALLRAFVEQACDINGKMVERARRSLSGNEANTRVSSFWNLLRRPVSYPVALFVIFLTLFASLGLTSQRAKDFISERIQWVYSETLRTSEQPSSKITAKEPERTSSEAFKERTQ